MSAPAAPGNLFASALNSSQIKVTWTASPGATSYDIFREALGDNAFVQVATGITTPTYTDNGLSAGMTYVYEVRANNGIGTSALSRLTTATTPIGGTPAAPSALVATAAGTSQISLKWTDNSNSETGFLIERSTDGISFTQIAAVLTNITGYTDSGLASATTCTYRVRAINAAGNSTYTSVATATTATPAPTAPAAPSSLAATAISESQINLTWTDNSSGTASFIIVRAIGTGGFVQLATVPAGLNTYSDTSLSPGTKYTYSVEATGPGGQSDFSNASTATTPGATPPPQPGPSRSRLVGAFPPDENATQPIGPAGAAGAEIPEPAHHRLLDLLAMPSVAADDPWPDSAPATRSFDMTLSEAPIGADSAAMGSMPGMAGIDGVSYRIDGQTFPATPVLRVVRGDLVEITFHNQGTTQHWMHLHGHFFRVLLRDGAPLPGRLVKDTVSVLPGHAVTIGFRADNPGWWMIHCHQLLHSAGGMMALIGL